MIWILMCLAAVLVAAILGMGGLADQPVALAQIAVYALLVGLVMALVSNMVRNDPRDREERQ
ncbi:DUF1328 domain-containing protein [Futiania mangrovi]|uniref:Uncharacterized protein n=1 Tax=Futiania mangrovi TaxID=2959716 RepID=A0A9J6P924_9PROT|nr:DUF1328 domain-containing protein [Futiania mangrovii]MCP1336356.1 hypothetical protein [Futiania mangrovii]